MVPDRHMDMDMEMDTDMDLGMDMGMAQGAAVVFVLVVGRSRWGSWTSGSMSE